MFIPNHIDDMCLYVLESILSDCIKKRADQNKFQMD